MSNDLVPPLVSSVPLSTFNIQQHGRHPAASKKRSCAQIQGSRMIVSVLAQGSTFWLAPPTVSCMYMQLQLRPDFGAFVCLNKHDWISESAEPAYNVSSSKVSSALTFEAWNAVRLLYTAREPLLRRALLRFRVAHLQNTSEAEPRHPCWNSL